ncbi:transcriptional regulator [Staphylococcus intermedius]|nr:transcriptional regulator [Staphylococcus intermedius]PNZ50910.1 transcriptional regulator [Staphylococcus intermedius NCTC 11048]PCF78921.1 transcriptional regulator [Staphylococcus intermedius]PCF79893.1 transcriptional regulator [Staphylococcus intermedius]PCF86355.1 transcriptional regulator [Staphylococcus intermedius]
MMIKIKLDEVLKEKDVSLTELSKAVDVTIANLSILKTGKAKAVRFSTLEAICKYLGCQPGDIIVYEES